jgi:hypothetical protein
MRLNTTTPGRTCEDRYAAYTWFEWFYRSPASSQVLESFGYVPLPDTIRSLLLTRLRAIFRCNTALYSETYPDVDVFFGVEPKAVSVVVKAPSAVSRVFSLFRTSYRKGRSGYAKVTIVDLDDDSVNASLIVADATEMQTNRTSSSGAPLMFLDFAATAWGASVNCTFDAGCSIWVLSVPIY